MLALVVEMMMQADSFVAPGAKIEQVEGTYQFTEGPCEQRDGSLIFSDIPASKLYRVKDGKVEVFREDAGQPNGNTLDREGRLLTCEHQTRRVRRTEKDGSITILADKYDGKKLNSPNDIICDTKGVIYFTDPPYGIRPEQADLDFNGVYRLKEGKLEVIARDFTRPNGLVLSPDEKWLYVADTAKGHIRRFAVGSDGAVTGGEEWAKTPNPDGLRVDDAGRVWSASRDGVNVISPEGKILEVIPLPQSPANLCFSRDGKSLFVTARTGVYHVKVSVKGIAP